MIRTIGDPGVRLREDPVRMLRAVALAARLGFTIDRDTLEAIRSLRGEIVKSSPARILDELYKILRQGASRKTFEMLHEHGLLAYLLPEADAGHPRAGRAPAGQPGPPGRLPQRGPGRARRPDQPAADGHAAGAAGPAAAARGGGAAPRRRREDEARPTSPSTWRAEMAALGARRPTTAPATRARRAGPALRAARRRPAAPRSWPPRAGCARCTRSPRVKQLLAGRGYLEEALRWLEIHGGVQGQELAAHWRGLELDLRPAAAAGAGAEPEDACRLRGAGAAAGAPPSPPPSAAPRPRPAVVDGGALRMTSAPHVR